MSPIPKNRRRVLQNGCAVIGALCLSWSLGCGPTPSCDELFRSASKLEAKEAVDLAARMRAKGLDPNGDGLLSTEGLAQSIQQECDRGHMSRSLKRCIRNAKSVHQINQCYADEHR